MCGLPDGQGEVGADVRSGGRSPVAMSITPTPAACRHRARVTSAIAGRVDAGCVVVRDQGMCHDGW